LDHAGQTDKFFAFVSGATQAEARDAAPGTTLMFSPDFISQEHPEECLEFWFYIKVKQTLIFPIYRTISHKKYKSK
jgi:hypothetical protein